MTRTGGAWRSAALVVLSLMAWSARADAQAPEPEHPFGAAGQWAFGIENAVGIDYQTDTRNNGGLVQTTDTFDASVDPRAAVDRFFTQGWSLGASLRVFRSATRLQTTPILTTTPPTTGTTTVASSNTSMLDVAFGPRAGFALPLTRWLWLWPRAGLTLLYGRSAFGTDGQATEDTSSVSLYVEVEAPLVFRVAPHVALTAAPSFTRTLWSRTTLNVSLASGPGTDHDTLTEVALLGGLVLYL